jgi:hypothetical protein
MPARASAARTPRTDAPPPQGTVFFKRSPRTRWKTWLLRVAIALAVLLVLAVLGIVAALHLARLEVLERIAALGAETGRVVLVDDVELQFDGTVRLRGLRASEPADASRTALAADIVEARFDVSTLLAGSKRPDALRVVGLWVALRADGGRYGGLDDLVLALRPPRKESEPKKISRPIPTLELEGATVLVSGPGGAWSASAEGVTGTVESDDDDPALLRAAMRGALVTGTRRSGFALDAGIERGAEPRRMDVRLSLDEPLELPELPELRGRTVRVGGLAFESGRRVGAIGVEVLARDASGELERELRADTIAVALSGGSLPEPRDVTAFEVEGLSARHDESALSAKRITVELSPAGDEAAAPLDDPAAVARELLGRLRRFTANDLAGRHDGRTLEARTAVVSLRPAGRADPDTSEADALLARLEVVELGGMLAEDAGGWPRLAADELEARIEDLSREAPLDGVRRLRLAHPRIDLKEPASFADGDGPWGAILGAVADDEPAPEDAVPTAEDAPPADEPKKPQAAPAAPLIPKLDLKPLLARASRVDLRVQDGEVVLRSTLDGSETLRMSGIDAIVAPGDAPGSVRFDLATHMTEDTQHTTALRVAGRLEADGRLGALDIETSGKRLAQLLGQLSPKIHVVPSSELSLEVHLDPTDPERPSVKAHVNIRDLGIDYWRIAHVPVTGISLEADLVATYDRNMDELTAQLQRLRFGEAEFSAEAKVQRASDVPVLDLRIRMPEQSCTQAARSIPKAMIPRLSGLNTTGTIWFDLNAHIDMRDSYSFKLDLDGDLESCIVLDIGGDVNVERLNSRRFVHRVVVEGQDIGQKVGPGSGSWTRLSALPSYVGWAAISTEDLAFYDHNGFRLNLIKRAVKLDLDRGRYVYGGSTISQQLVKNLFLSREKTLSRKAEEAILTWHMEQRVEKARILELYVNCIEYGPEIWGITRAAKAYFNKRPQDLTPLETAFLMGLKPCPRCGYNQYKHRTFAPWWHKRMEGVLTRLRDRGWITEEQFEESRPFVPAFYYPGEGMITPGAKNKQ